MGWTSLYRPKGTSNAEFFASEFGSQRRIEENATIRGAFYAAVRNLETDEVWGLVALIRWAPRSSYNFTYKTMSEDMGPCYYDAPAKVLDRLTPTESTYALEWREKCRAELARKATQVKLKAGARVEFHSPLTFTDGAVIDSFVFEGRNTFRDPNTSRRYRIPHYADRGFEVHTS